jgi:hypothetical protein
MSEHLRGRARIIGRVNRKPVWEWAVINTTTGEVVAQDNTCLRDVAEAVDEAALLTDICRTAFIRGIKQKSMRAAS